MNELETRVKQNLNLCNRQLETTTPLQSYFLGKEDMINFVVNQKDLVVCGKSEIETIKDESYRKGFEKGKEFIVSRLKCFEAEL